MKPNKRLSYKSNIPVSDFQNLKTGIEETHSLCKECDHWRPKEEFERMSIHSGLKEGGFAVCNICIIGQK